MSSAPRPRSPVTMKGVLPFLSRNVYPGATTELIARAFVAFRPTQLVFLPDIAGWFHVNALGLFGEGEEGKLVKSFLDETPIHGGFFNQNSTPLELPFIAATENQEFRLKVTNISGLPGSIHALLAGEFLE